MDIRSIFSILLLLLSACNDQQVQHVNGDEDRRTLLEMEVPLPIDDRAKILVVHKYDPQDSRFLEIERGVLRGLNEEGFMPYKNIILDFITVRSAEKLPSIKRQQVFKTVIEKINDWQPDIVLADGNVFDENSIGDMINIGKRCIFFALEDNLGNLLDDLRNTANESIGIIVEDVQIERTIRLLQYLAPEVRKIAVISDSSTDGTVILQRLLKMSGSIDVEVVSSSIVEKFEQWKNFIGSIQDQADALVVAGYQQLEDDFGQQVPAQAVIEWTVQHSVLPDAGFEAAAVRDGLMSSETTSLFSHAYLAATMAAYSLAGQPPGDFTVQGPRYGELHINRYRTATLEIEIPTNVQQIAVLHPQASSEEASDSR